MGAGSQQVLRRVDILFNSASTPLPSSPWGRIHPPSRLRPSLEHLHLCLLGIPISVTIPSNWFLTSVSLPLRWSPPGIRKKYGKPCMCFLVVQMVMTACNAGDPGSIPRLKRSPGGGNGNSLEYSFLENCVVRGASWATVHGVTNSRTQLRD